MNTELQIAIEAMYESLKKAPVSSFRPAFVQYCRKALALPKQYKITKQNIARVIAGAMFLNGADDFRIEEITSLAGLLEVPAYYSDQEWERLLMLIEDLSTEH